MKRLPVAQSLGGTYFDFTFEVPLPRNYVVSKGTANMPVTLGKAYPSGRPLPKWYRPPGFDEGRRRSEPGPRGP